MAIRVQPGFPSAAVPLFRGVSRPFARGFLAASFRRWRERRILAVLDERMLRDIGVSRSQALAEAGKPFWRR